MRLLCELSHMKANNMGFFDLLIWPILAGELPFPLLLSPGSALVPPSSPGSVGTKLERAGNNAKQGRPSQDPDRQKRKPLDLLAFRASTILVAGETLRVQAPVLPTSTRTPTSNLFLRAAFYRYDTCFYPYATGICPVTNSAQRPRWTSTSARNSIGPGGKPGY
jgi:hypothetical protein